MGYDMSIYIQVQPAEQYGPVTETIEEKYGQSFEDDGGGEGHDYETRWPGLTDDMIDVSKAHPEATIRMWMQGRDGQQWCEYFRVGKHYEIHQDDFCPPEPDDAKFEDPNSKVYTVILLYPEGIVETWCGTARGTTPEEAIADARRQVIEDGGTVDAYEPEDYTCIACLEGEHQDLGPKEQ